MSNSNREDRTVHALTDTGDEIVRYDRAGKWFVEPKDGSKRTPVTLTRAAELAIAGTVFPARAGGQAFNAKVTKLR